VRSPAWHLLRTVERLLIYGPWLIAALALLGLAYDEMQTARLQAEYLPKYAAQLSFQLGEGPTTQVRYPVDGPYDQRFGYVQIPRAIARLRGAGYQVTEQACMSPALIDFMRLGLFAIYDEKDQAGLHVYGNQRQALVASLFPRKIYARFEDIPPVIVDTLLFIENRTLLDADEPHQNPALEWERLGKAVYDKAMQFIEPGRNVPGGSTLATQLEKFRHSPDGITGNATEKLRQMVSASLRAYQHGPDTLPARRNIVRDYLNTVPLAAARGYGEINGYGDGVEAWFGADFDTFNSLLHADAIQSGGAVSAEAGRAYREALSLLIAHRRPSYYLSEGYTALQSLTDSYLRALASAKVITPALRDAALAAHIELRRTPPPDTQPFAARKSATTMRTRLAQDLGIDSLYDLDRLDLSVQSTLNVGLQHQVTDLLRKLREPAFIDSAGLTGFRLFGAKDDLSRVVYSFTLYERGAEGNLLRVQTDNYDQPLDINEGVKLDLGSTAKLRTLVLYLEIVSDLYKHYAPLPPEQLRAQQPDPRDVITRWLIDYLLATPGHSLSSALDAAMARRYSASTAETFFTGGGVHTFVNFKADEDSKVYTVEDALHDSVNLVFIRLMRDIAYHYIYKPDGMARQLENPDDPRRQQYLQRFADREGTVFLRRFYAKYQGKDVQQSLDLLLQGMQITPARLVTIYRSVLPQASAEEVARFLYNHINTQTLDEAELDDLYRKYSPQRFNLQDRGYIARVHPLELWLIGYLHQHPAASISEVIKAGAAQRQSVYSWLFKTRRRNKQDIRIRTLLEIEAFGEIHQAWKRLGYPFDSLVPSYATAIGSSADRPAALAELMGILVNNGRRLPMVRFTDFHFAAGTPYEARLVLPASEGEQVLDPQIAAVARRAIIGVVEEGTARRLGHPFIGKDGQVIPVGGKTGTGDNRLELFGPGGRLIDDKVVNRTATFVFMIGSRYFGTMTAFVEGDAAAHYRFTSALPVQVLKVLAPALQPLFAEEKGDAAAVREATER
jgi:membrane peptidoglycan carboxypeptidase